MADEVRRSGKKGRKINRSQRKPSHQRYNAEGRREKNKERKAATYERQQERNRVAREKREAQNVC